MAEKRPLDSAQNDDCYAVCPSCHRLSSNPTLCDRCGTRLSQANTTECLSSQPKRARTESSSSPVHPDRPRSSSSNSSRPPSQNGVATTTPSIVSTETGTMNPVPQQLYMNTMNATSVPSALPQLPAAPSSLSVPRPQQLYLNVSNPGYPSLMQPVSASASLAGTNSLLNSTNGPTSVPNLRANNGIGLAAPGMMAGALQRAAAPGSVAADPTRANGQSVLAAAGLATSLPAQQAAQFTRNPPPVHQAAQTGVPAISIPHKFYINVQQIRIGLRGFAPASTVQFKDDGVLFTLKEYPNAPLLLNIRAIMKCRANLVGSLPAMFFYLESSCIKQIRAIFHMKEFEFNEKSNIDKVKCVGVFPSDLNPREAKMIENIFSVMKTSSQRSDPILETISPEDVLDILYGTWTTVSEIYTAQRESGQVSNSVPASSRGPPSQMPTASQMLQTTTHMSSRPPTTMTRGPVPGLPMAAPAAAPRQLAPSVSQVNNGSQPPVLVIPSDSSRWQIMKKSLMVGGVYQVQTQNGQRKYCLWNGQELMPCLVQDTEVQLKCTNLRIGSLKIPSTSAVRVQNDNNNRGISFKFTLEERTISMFIPQSGITDAYLCADSMFQALFLYTNSHTSSKICSQCNMASWSADPFYSSASRKERQRHLILFLKEVNTDQKEALLSMKINAPPIRRFIQEIPIIKALEILSVIKSNSMVQSKMDDYIGTKATPKPTSNYVDSLVKFVSGKETAEEDDDDVIMTSEEVGTKCPYTQQIMKEPVQNIRCLHNYEKAAILEFIQRKKAKNIEAICPYAGCGNQIPLRIQELKDNHELRAYIAKNHPAKT